MSFSLSSIVSDISSLATDPGKLAKDVCDAVLPQNMKAIGDIVGGAVDYETGHPLQALGHLADALKDLPQMAQGLSPAKGNLTAAPAGSLAAEPAPPPPRAPGTQPPVTNITVPPGTSQPSTTSSAQPAANNVTVATGAATSISTTGRPGSQVTVTVGADGKDVTIIERSARGRTREITMRAGAPTPAASAPAASAPAASAPAATPAASGSSTTATASKAATGGSATNGASGAAGTDPSDASTSASSSEGAVSTSASSSASKGAASTGTPSSLSDLMALSPDQFMQAVTSGKIPADVANNPSAMTQIQARMNQITQMNQLVTSMMAAMHQMQMSIIQNIRV